MSSRFHVRFLILSLVSFIAFCCAACSDPAEDGWGSMPYELPEEDGDDSDGDDGSFNYPASWTLLLADTAPDAVGWAADDLAKYFTAMGQTVLRAGEGNVDCVEGEGKLVMVGDGLGQSEVIAEGTNDQTWKVSESRCGSNGTVIVLDGGGLFGRQYAVYELLHKLGVRFFHPEEEYVPAEPDWPAEAIAFEKTPDFTWRSVSLHLTHPLELGDPIELGKSEYDMEVIRYIDWSIKNLSSRGRGGHGSGEYSDYGYRRGFARGAGMSLFGQQQGASGIYNPDDPRSMEEQVVDHIDERMGDDPDNWPEEFSFSFNPTEFTEIDDQQAVKVMTLIANHITENYPGVRLMTTNHGTYGEPTDYYGVRYYDLPKFAPEALGVKCHTLMFYDMFRPAPMYGNESFNFMYDFMASEYQKREIWHFPESAWWLTFDNAVPLYLPITIEARDRDIQGIAFMLDGKLTGHRTFGSGHEWGYWQNEYCSLRMAADVSYRYTDCLADITYPMGEAADTVKNVLLDIIQLQERDIIYGDTLAYLVGTDPETEIAQSIGISFHPLPPSPIEIMTWNEETVHLWFNRIDTGLKRMEADYLEQLARLDAVREQVPEEALHWFTEIYNGLEVTMLRARHGYQVYGAVVMLRLSQLDVDDTLATQAQGLLDAAIQTTEDARAVILRQEEGYRYQPVQRAIGFGDALGDDENWTIYPYRVHGRAHYVYYYTRIDDLVQGVFDGGSDPITVADAVLGADESLMIDVIDSGLSDVRVDLGDGNQSNESHIEHDYAQSGVYTVTVSAQKEGEDFSFSGNVAAVDEVVATGFSGDIIEPSGAALIESVLPGLVLGKIGSDTLIAGFTASDSDSVRMGRFTELTPVAGDNWFDHAVTDFIVPVINKSQEAELTEIMVYSGKIVITDLQSPVRLTGQLGTEAVIQAVVAVGGFEEEGARDLVAGILGYTPETMPERVPFEMTYSLKDQGQDEDGDIDGDADGDDTDGDTDGDEDGDDTDGDIDGDVDGDDTDGDTDGDEEAVD